MHQLFQGKTSEAVEACSRAVDHCERDEDHTPDTDALGKVGTVVTSHCVSTFSFFALILSCRGNVSHALVSGCLTHHVVYTIDVPDIAPWAKIPTLQCRVLVRPRQESKGTRKQSLSTLGVRRQALRQLGATQLLEGAEDDAETSLLRAARLGSTSADQGKARPCVRMYHTLRSFAFRILLSDTAWAACLPINMLKPYFCRTRFPFPCLARIFRLLFGNDGSSFYSVPSKCHEVVSFIVSGR